MRFWAANMQDWIGKTLRLVGQPIFEKLRGGLESLLGFLDSPAVQGAISTFAGWIANGIDGAIKSVDSLVKALTNSPIAKTISGIVTDIKEDGLGGAIKKWIGNAIDTVKDPAKRAAFIADLGASITAIAEGARAYYEANIAPTVAALGETIATWVQGGIDWLESLNAYRHGNKRPATLPGGADLQPAHDERRRMGGAILPALAGLLAPRDLHAP
jgi:phage tail tape-measure protein